MTRAAQIAIAVAVVFVLVQVFFALLGIDGFWQWGHHGFNPAAYQIAAWNTLEWGTLFPAQYHTQPVPPPPNVLYTNAPLALHLHTVAAVGLLGDGRWVVRLVPALHGVLAAIALFWVVRRHYGDARAALALGIYVLLPVNHGYANMTNHSTGFILWGLLALDAHLSGRRWLRLVTIVLCCNWDWPGYYIAFAIALHWVGSMWRRRAWSEWRDLAVFCVVVLVSFGGFFLMAYLAVGSFDGMQSSWSLRTKELVDVGNKLWDRSLEPMFGLAAMGTAGLWAASRLAVLRERDLIPLAFLFAGVTHTALFKATAVVHIYWPWPLAPFLAIAAADLLWSSGDLAARWGWLPRVVLVTVFAGFFLSHTLPLVPELRRKGGSLHFQPYDPNYPPWIFAREVNRWSAAGDDIHLLYGMNTRPEILATLHRPVTKERRRRKSATLEPGVHLAGDLRYTDRGIERAAQRRGTVRVVHPYFYASPSGTPGRIDYRMEFGQPSLVHRLLWSPFVPPVRIIEVEGSAAGTPGSPP